MSLFFFVVPRLCTGLRVVEHRCPLVQRVTLRFPHHRAREMRMYVRMWLGFPSVFSKRANVDKNDQLFLFTGSQMRTCQLWHHLSWRVIPCQLRTRMHMQRVVFIDLVAVAHLSIRVCIAFLMARFPPGCLRDAATRSTGPYRSFGKGCVKRG